MSTTLAAVFESYGEANEASSKLQTFGVDKQSIQLNGASSAPIDTSARSRTVDDDEPGAISRFFSSMFGDDDKSNASTYSEAAQRGHVVLTVAVVNEDDVDDISDILNDCGAIDVDEREQQWKAADGQTGKTVAPLAGAGVAMGASDDGTLKRIEESLQIGKRNVQKGSVRVHQRVVETPVEEQVSLREERASIERTKVDRPATEADLQNAFKDKDISIIETAEEAVVAKTAKVVEEVHVGKKATDRTETVRETLRRTEIDVENGDNSTLAAGSNKAYPV